MLFALVVLIFAALICRDAFVDARQARGGVQWRGRFWVGVLICVVLGMFDWLRGELWFDALSKPLGAMYCFLGIAGIAWGLGWLFRARKAREEAREQKIRWVNPRGNPAIWIVGIGGLLIGGLTAQDRLNNPRMKLSGSYRVIESTGFGDSMKGANLTVDSSYIYIRGTKQAPLQVPYVRQTWAWAADGCFVIKEGAEITWVRDRSTGHVQMEWPAFGSKRRLLLQPIPVVSANVQVIPPVTKVTSALSAIDQIQKKEDLEAAEQVIFKAKTRGDIDEARKAYETVEKRWRRIESFQGMLKINENP